MVRTEVRLAAWTRHHSTCARVTAAADCDCGLNALLLELRAEAAVCSRGPEDGVAMIAAERSRQVNAEGWSPEHDDKHCNGELALSAARYAVEHTRRNVLKGYLAEMWVWGSCWWKPKNPIRNLVRAGALIAAEIDRLKRCG